MPLDDPRTPSLKRLLLVGCLFFAGAALMLPLDPAIVVTLNAAEGDVVDACLKFFHHVVPVVVLAGGLFVGGALWVRGRTPAQRRGGLFLAAAPFLANGVTSILKDLVGRARPQHDAHGLEALRILVEDADRRSFPSGHVTTAAAFVVAMWFALPPFRGRRFLLLVVPLMMWDRVALAVHFPSDTLAGVGVACFTCAALAWALGTRDPRMSARWRPLAILAGVLAITWAWSGGTRPVDPVTMESIDGLRLDPSWWRSLLEPFVGPPLEVAWAPGPRRLAVETAPWLLVVLLAAVWMAPPPRRRRVLGLALCLLIAWGGLFWTGRLPADRFAHDVEGVFFDPHVHGSDPVDGALPWKQVLTRKRARGVHVVALTNHDAPPPAPGALPGLEWSGGRHGDEAYLHLLILGGSGAFDAVMGVVVPPLAEAGETARARGIEAVRVAKQHGAVVLVAHHWRTLAKMREDGTAHHLPSPVELAEAGADGFEVANRHWEADPEGRRRVEAIDALCRDRGLLRVASSDDHGIPAGSPCVTFLPGSFPDDPAARRDAVLERLRTGGDAWPVVWMREKRAERPWGVLAGPVFVARYLAGLSLLGRFSWLAWFVLAWRWTVRRSRPGSPEPGRSSSPRR
ncbi:MAG: phosphatase PAP2 family protein [Planctomycetes bacterium]|nr:phosphatase PAP2 family protein [Planctomycetota bacterium]